MKKLYYVIVVSRQYLKNLKYHTFSKNISSFVLFAVSAKIKMNKYVKNKNQLRY